MQSGILKNNLIIKEYSCYVFATFNSIIKERLYLLLNIFSIFLTQHIYCFILFAPFSDRYWHWVKNLWVFSENSEPYFEKYINFSTKEANWLLSC